MVHLLLAVVPPAGALDAEDPAIHSLRVASERAYELVHYGLGPGVQQYTDRPYRFGAVPRALVGATFIRTANDDKAVEDPEFIRFRAERPVTVYVAHDNRARGRPDWLADFESTGEQLLIDDFATRGFALFRRDFPAGPVVLPGNGSQTRSEGSYTVIVKAMNDDNLPPVAEASLDRRLWWPRNELALFGSAADDRRTPEKLTYLWSLEEGPAPVRFSDAGDPLARVAFATTGVYRLRLTVSDDENDRHDIVRVHVVPQGSPHREAAYNAYLAREAFRRSRRFHDAWLARADPTTGLIPRALHGPHIWSGHDAAADCYPFIVLSAALTDPAAFAGPCRAMLETERTLTARLGRLPDVWHLKHRQFLYSEIDVERIQFGASEYIKDGLLPIAEWLGASPWLDRMLELVEDCWAHADVETPFGTIVSLGHENNGEMLQTLSRLFWMTGERRYLDWALRLGDYYLLGTNHPTRDEERIRLRDHGCEVVSGLCELYATLRFAEPEKADGYKKPLYEMLDRILEVGVNEDGFFYDIVNPRSGEILLPRLGDTFAYNYNGYYTVYLVDGHTPYRDAVLKVLKALPRHPAFHGDEAMDGNADALEGALYLHNREPSFALAGWIDHAARTLWDFQKENGLIHGSYLDGNFSRSTLLYALWKTQGATVQPWRDDLQLGATRNGREARFFLSAQRDWSGRLHFDQPRHRTHFNLPFDWPRINQFSPEWTTVDPAGTYLLENADTGARTSYRGEELIEGLPIALAGGEVLRLVLHCEDPPRPTRITTPAGRTVEPGSEVRLAGVGDELRWHVERSGTGDVVAEGRGKHLSFIAPEAGAPLVLRVRLEGAGGPVEQSITVAAGN